MYCKNRHGVINFKVDNVSYKLTASDVSVNPVDVTVEAKPHGHSTASFVSPSIEAAFMVPDGMNVTDLLQRCGRTIICEEWNGRTWLLQNAQPTFSERPYNVSQGEVSIVWVGDRIRELNPNQQDFAAA